MARSNVLAYHQLEAGLVLAPERYDPRRTPTATEGVTLFSIAEIVSDQVQPAALHADKVIVLDTGDARDGLIRGRLKYASPADVLSAKKIVSPGDVIVSRLRPYLQQVAFVDPGLFTSPGEPIRIICSTEFFVIRSRDQRSIAFLAPFLLTKPVQQILAAAQEGGHHPRFNRNTLTSLVIPAPILERSETISHNVIRAAELSRESDTLIRTTIIDITDPVGL
jgi:hypothetical protein